MLNDLFGKHRKKAIAALIAIGAIGIGYLGSLTDSYGDCASKHKTNYTDYENPAFFEATNTVFACEGAAVDANGNAITGIATILLAYITYLLVRLGHEQSVTSRAELRAYVQFEEAGIPKGRVRTDITVKNFGQTPAEKVIHWADAVFCDQDFVPTFAPPDGFEWSPPISLAPTAVFQIRQLIRNVRKPVNKFVAGSRGRFFVWGEIVYVDVFGEKQSLPFQFWNEEPGGALMWWGAVAGSEDVID